MPRHSPRQSRGSGYSRPQVEELEPRVLLSQSPMLLEALRPAVVHPRQARTAPTARSVERPYLLRVPGQPGQTVALHFDWLFREANYQNEMGLFRVDNAQGWIGRLKPGDRGYAAAALSRARRRVLFARGEGPGVRRPLRLPGGSFFGMYLVQDATTGDFLAQNRANRLGKGPLVFFSIRKANPDHFEHGHRLSRYRYAWEDMTKGGDRDFNDLICSWGFEGRHHLPPPLPPVRTRQDTTPPWISASLSHDTAQGGGTNTDRITFDPAIAGAVIDTGSPVTRFWAGFDATPVSNFVDVFSDLGPGGTFAFDRPRIDQIFGRSLPDGPHTLHLRAQDGSGNLSPVYDVPFLRDTTVTAAFDLAPESDTAPLGDHETELASGTLAGQTEPGAVVALQETAATPPVDQAGRFQVPGVNLVLGDQVFHVRAEDIAGNVTIATQTITRFDCSFDAELTGWTVSQDGGSGEGQGTVVADQGSALMREGNSFTVTLARSFQVPANPRTLGFEYADLNFDMSDTASINDAFEAALLDAQGHTLVHTIGTGRDSFFNITEGMSAALGREATLTGQTVMLDISGVTPGIPATLVFRLVNNDQDTNTSVRITCVHAAGSGGGQLPGPIEPLSGGAESAQTSDVPPSTQGASTRLVLTPATPASVLGSQGSLQGAAPLDLPNPGDSVLDEQSRVTFTTTADFEQGTLFNVNATDVPDELRLSQQLTTFPYIWISNTNDGTVSKFDVRTGKELGRYRTGPDPNAGWLQNSRTAVDSEGNVWVANRAFGQQASIVKVLNTGFIDRNGNGVPDTSQDLNGDGHIAGDELLHWSANSGAQPDDERIALSIPVGRNRSNPNILLGNGVARSIAIDANDDIWVGLYYLNQYEVYDHITGELKAIVPTQGTPYGAVIDANGQLWGATLAGEIDHIDTTTRTFVGAIGTPGSTYGITIDPDGVVWTSFWYGGLARYDPATGSLTTYPTPGYGEHRGVAVDQNRNVWVANTSANQLDKLVFAVDHKTLLSSTTVNVGREPTAAVIDADGYVWTTCRADNTAWKIDPNTNTVVPGWPVTTGNYPYNYSDMTGQLRLTVTQPTGIWAQIIDSQRTGTQWGAITLDQDTPAGTAVEVRARVSNDRSLLQNLNYVEVQPGQFLSDFVGQYLQVEVTLRSDSHNVTPDVKSITVAAVPPPAVSVSWPADGSEIAAGTSVVLSGEALAGHFFLGDQLLAANQIVSVTVNGTPVDALDAGGNFFSQVGILPGENRFSVTATDAFGQTGTATVTVVGTQKPAGVIDFDRLVDVTASFRPEYARTSFDEDSRTLFADVAIANVGQYPADAPLLVAVTHLSDPQIRVLAADGTLPDGTPYYDFTGLVTGGTLAPHGLTGALAAVFLNPGRVQFDYDLVFYGKLNEPPEVTTIPVVDATAGRPYAYDAGARDPDGDPLSFGLVSGPAGMTIDAASGLVAWSPATEDIGTHVVVLRVEDGRRGSALQRFVLSVGEAPPNRPPVFFSAPVVTANVNTPYSYQVNVRDPDGDPLTFAVAAGPAGMTIDSDGLVTWTPTAAERGIQNVTLTATDGQGNTSEQSYAVIVLAEAHNHNPLFVSTPVTRALAGQEYAYPVKALDPDGDDLSYSLSSAPGGMTIDPVTGLIGWDAVLAPSPYDVVVRVEDGRGGLAMQAFALEVVSATPNVPPVITSTAPVQTAVNHTYVYDVTAADPDGDPLRFQLTQAPAGMTIDAFTGRIRWTPTAVQLGTNPVTVQVSDGRNGTDRQSFEIMVVATSANQPPHITSTSPTVGVVGQLYRYNAIATDPNADVVSFDLPVKPVGMTVDRTSGIVVWEPGADQVGTFDVVLRVSDGYGGIDLQPFQVDVTAANNSPVITSSPALRVAEGQPYRYLVRAQDADGDPLTYTLAQGPAGMTLDRTTGLLAWDDPRQTALQFDGVNDYVQVTDSPSLRPANALTVEAWVNPGANFTASTRHVIAKTVGGGTNNSYVIWYAGGQLRAMAGNASATTSQLSYTWSPTPGTSYHVAFTYDASGPKLYINGSLVASNSSTVALGYDGHPLLIGADINNEQVGERWSGQIDDVRIWNVAHSQAEIQQSMSRTSTGTEPGLVGYWRFDEGAGTTTRDLSPNGNTSVLGGGNPDNRPAWVASSAPLTWQEGVAVRVEDGRGGADTQSFTLEMGLFPNDPPAITSQPRRTFRLGGTYYYPVEATDPNGDPLTYSFDNNPVGMTIDPAGLVSWTPTDAQLGDHLVTVRIEDGRAGFVTQTYTLTVATQDQNTAPRIVSAPKLVAFADKLYQYNLSAVDREGDALVWSLDQAPANVSLDPRTGALRWTPTADQVGAQEVRVRVSDALGASDTQSFTVGVRLVNTPPTITSAPPTRASLGYPYRYAVRAIDPDGDPLSFSLATAPQGMTIDQSTGLLRWNYATLAAGKYPVVVRVEDGLGGAATQSYTVELGLFPNDPPRITSTPRDVVRLGGTYLYQVEAVDPNGDPLTYLLFEKPAGMTIDPASGLVEWDTTGAALGTQQVRVAAADDRGLGAVQVFTLTVVSADSNQSPRIVSTPLLTASAGRLYQYHLDAVDPERDPFSWSLEEGPDNMALDPGQGVLAWTPRSDQEGTHNIRVKVTDALGASSEQSFAILVRVQNAAPVITSIAPTRANAGDAYQYAVRAADPDGDALTFTLLTAPTGMRIDPERGLIWWRPTAAQQGQHAVEVQVADGLGGVASQSYTLRVTVGEPNQAPVITSAPTFETRASAAYQYAVTARDPDGDRPHFELLTFPEGMTIDPVTGVLNWTPEVARIGAHPITVAAFDDSGAGSSQTYTLLVREANRPPEITSTPVTEVTGGLPYRYDVGASDPDGDPLRYAIARGPAGMTIDGLGRISWSPSLADEGPHPVEVTVTDNYGASATQSFDVTVTRDLEAPRVNLRVSPNRVPLGSRVTFLVSATDNVGVQSVSLKLGDTPVVLDAKGSATVTVDRVGLFTATATATDAAGNTAQTTAELLVIDPAVTGAPTVVLTAPAAGAVITAPTDVTGTARDANLLYYALSVAPFGSRTFREVARGTSSVTGGMLGKFDPSLLANDTYTLRLTAVNSGGIEASTETTVNVAGDLKLGNFTLSFTDLTIPVSGIPITVSRTYDTLNAATSDDFGYGWRLEFADVRLRTNVPEPEVEMKELGFLNGFRNTTRVYITLPGGQRQGFTFKPVLSYLSRLLGSYINLSGEAITYEPAFEADPGVTSTLSLVYADRPPLMFQSYNGEYIGIDGSAFNPAGRDYSGEHYVLTTKDGTAYQIDPVSGQLRKVTDPNGNTLNFSDDGITSSSGKRVTFDRDPQGRIVAVTDPMGNQVRYRYDGRSDLVSVIDQANNTTRFVYRTDRPHYLDRVIDPLGRTGARSEYDAQGRLGKVFDATGKPVQFTYDPDHDVETVVDALGNPTRYEYDRRGNIVTEIDALGGITRRTYDANDNLLTETDPLGHVRSFSYDAGGNVLTETDPLGNVTRYTYGPYARPLTKTDPLGNTVRGTYDGAGNMTGFADGAGDTSTATYDGQGRELSVTLLGGRRTAYEYGAFATPTRVVDPLGHETISTYDGNGNLTTETQFRTVGGTRQALTTTYEYDKLGRVVAITDPLLGTSRTTYNATGQVSAEVDQLGRRTEFTYDELGRQVRTTFPDGASESSAYDAAGNKVRETDRAGRVTYFEYDALYRLTTTILPDQTPDDLTDNPRTRTEYDLAGHILAETDAGGNRTDFEYDAAGNRIQVVLPPVFDPAQGKMIRPVERYEYDARGQLIARVDAVGHRTEYQADAVARPLQVQYPNGNSGRFSYNPNGRDYQYVDPLGRTVSLTDDLAANLVSVTLPAPEPGQPAVTTHYSYDEVGNLVAQTDALDHTTRYVYDKLGRMVEKVLPGGESQQFGYDSAGQLTSVTDVRGTTSYAYDLAGRLIRKTYPDGSSVTFTYTPTGQRETVTDARGVTTYAYDAQDRLLSRRDPDGTTISYTYDDAGNRTSVTTLAGTTAYTFDAQNRLQSVTDPAGQQTHYFYDAVGNLVRTELPDQTVEQRHYDDLNRLTGIETRDRTGSPLSSYVYVLDDAGKRVDVTELDGRRTEYVYDDLSRLIAERRFDPGQAQPGRTITYTYDRVGNQLTRVDSLIGTTTSLYDADDRLLSESAGGSTTVYSYDANGNMTGRTTNGVDRTVYRWDYEDRLIGVDTDGNGTFDLRYEYDADGIRVAEVVNGEETRFLVDPERDYPQVLLERTASGIITVSYVYGQDLISQTREGEVSIYHKDALGSTQFLTDGSGTITGTYDYLASGETAGFTGSTPNAYLFAGEQLDGNTGFYYLRARYYDPARGRFLSPDPYPGLPTDPQSLHRYAYAHLDPVNNRDPSGLVTLQELDVTQTIKEILRAIRTGAVHRLEQQFLGKSYEIHLAWDKKGGIPIVGHFFPYMLLNLGKPGGIRYDIGFKASSILGQALTVAFAGPGTLKVKIFEGKKQGTFEVRVATLNLIQYAVWNAIVLPSGKMLSGPGETFLTSDIGFTLLAPLIAAVGWKALPVGLPLAAALYLQNCLTFTGLAGLTAVGLSLVPVGSLT